MLHINKLINDFFNEPKFAIPSVFGELKTEKGSDENGDWKKQTYQSKDGSLEIVTFYRSGVKDNEELQNLENELKNAVNDHDFERAITLRDKIKSLKSEQDQISELEKSLDDAIDTEDFELAIELRDKLKTLRTK